MYRQDTDLTAGSPETGTDQRWTARNRESFFLHLRPKKYQADSVQFRHTLHLGFWTSFLLALETLTGILLMLYYVPTPEDAYGSLQRLMAAVPFGSLCRDLHRLGGDLLIVVAVLHLLRVVLTGSYNGPRRFTWVTGVMLLVLLLALAFSGYLLPWDQLSYWAVTVGTSLFSSIPLIGEPLQHLLRGGSEIGGEGLLRFYAMHVVILPVLVMMLFATHYYRLARLHGVSLPAGSAPDSRTPQTIPMWPEMANRELLLILAGTLLLLVIVSLFYDAPLGPHADPRQAPSHTTAPWFFLWIQGLLTLGPPLVTGILLPSALVALVLLLPYLGPRLRPEQPAKKRITPAVSMALLLLLVGLSLFGNRTMQPDTMGPETLLNHFASADDEGTVAALDYADLKSGVYPLLRQQKSAAPAALAAAITGLENEMQLLQNNGHCKAVNGMLVIEPLQQMMKRLTLRLSCTVADTAEKRTHERMLFRTGVAADPGDFEEVAK